MYIKKIKGSSVFKAGKLGKNPESGIILKMDKLAEGLKHSAMVTVPQRKNESLLTVI